MQIKKAVAGSTTAEHFAATINQLKGKVYMLFINLALPKIFQVDEYRVDRAGRFECGE